MKLVFDYEHSACTRTRADELIAIKNCTFAV